MSTSVSKIVAQRNQRTLLELSLKPGNDVCADCKARTPRWASHNLGIFICVSCASIHRKIGTHITKVKSITLDEWSKEQVEVMKENGNTKSNALYNPNEARHPPPTNMIDSERDSELEKFIRSKYEFKRFMDRKSGSLQPLAELRGPSRSRSTPLIDSSQTERRLSTGPPPPPKTPENLPPGLRHSATILSLSNNAPPRSVSQPLPPPTNPEKPAAALPLGQFSTTQPQKPTGKVWEDLISLQEPPYSSSLPLQYGPVPFFSQPQASFQQQPVTPGNVPNPFMNLSLGQPLVASPASISTPGPMFPFTPSAPLSSPALPLGATNPFNQAFSSSSVSVNGTGLATNSNPFTSSAHPVMSFPTGTALHTPPLGYVPSQTPTPIPTLVFPPASFAPTPTAAPVGLSQIPLTPMASPAQIPLTGNVSTNPFSARQAGQGEFPGMTPQAALLGQQQQSLGSTHGYNAWAGPGVQGAF